MVDKTNSELLALIKEQAIEIGNLREEIGRLKALLEVSNHQRRTTPEDNPASIIEG